jgi:hypothetical protein
MPDAIAALVSSLARTTMPSMRPTTIDASIVVGNRVGRRASDDHRCGLRRRIDGRHDSDHAAGHRCAAPGRQSQ